MRIVCWQTILMKYHTLFFRKFEKMSQNLSSASAAVVILRINTIRNIAFKAIELLHQLTGL